MPYAISHVHLSAPTTEAREQLPDKLLHQIEVDRQIALSLARMDVDGQGRGASSQLRKVSTRQWR